MEEEIVQRKCIIISENMWKLFVYQMLEANDAEDEPEREISRDLIQAK